MTLSPERQSAWMSKITNDSSTRSGTKCFATEGVKGLMNYQYLKRRWVRALPLYVNEHQIGCVKSKRHTAELSHVDDDTRHVATVELAVRTDHITMN